MTLSTKLAYQGYIQHRYPDLVKKYKDEMCRQCAFAAFGFEGCDKGLLPVTITGDACPYYISFKSARPARDPRRVLMGKR
jgi:hypothetical protein